MVAGTGVVCGLILGLVGLLSGMICVDMVVARKMHLRSDVRQLRLYVSELKTILTTGPGPPSRVLLWLLLVGPQSVV